MERSMFSFVQDHARFEVLPLGRSEDEARRLPHPVRLTVTCSPKHGPDDAVAVAGRLHGIGHALTVHVAARMVRDKAHLDALLAAMAQAGADDRFLIGGVAVLRWPRVERRRFSLLHLQSARGDVAVVLRAWRPRRASVARAGITRDLRPSRERSNVVTPSNLQQVLDESGNIVELLRNSQIG